MLCAAGWRRLLSSVADCVSCVLVVVMYGVFLFVCSCWSCCCCLPFVGWYVCRLVLCAGLIGLAVCDCVC